MTKNRSRYNNIFGITVGLLVGIAGTAFSLGANKQRVDDALLTNTSKIAALVAEEDAHQKATQNELNRFSEIIASQISLIQSSIGKLSVSFGELRTDVHVLKALMERMEIDLKTRG